jgi:DNA-binding NarL/FixJ family response regulator
MREPSPSPVVALINTSPDVIDMLRTVLERAGMVVVSAFTHDIRDGRVDFQNFMRVHEPDVVVYDIAPPYDANWNLFLHLCRSRVMRSRQFVITSTNAEHVESLAGSHQQVYEVVGKSVDLDRVVQAVKEATRARPTR